MHHRYILNNSQITVTMKQTKTIRYIDKKGDIKHPEDTPPPGGELVEKTFSNYTKYLNIGYYLVTPLVAGVFIGVKLDEWFNSKPLCTIIFIVAGAIASLYNLFKLTQEDASH